MPSTFRERGFSLLGEEMDFDGRPNTSEQTCSVTDVELYIFPPREATQSFCTELKFLSVSKIEVYAQDGASGARPV